MGNSRSRVAPTRSLKILDSQTRARYQNQHELVRLHAQIRRINIQQNVVLSRLTAARLDIKTDAKKLHHERQENERLRNMNNRT